MPELPEVETIRRIIEPQIIGRSIVSIRVQNPQIIACPETETFIASITSNTFTSMNRRGKFLIFNFDNGNSLVLHLRMKGQLLVTHPDYQEEKYTPYRRIV